MCLGITQAPGVLLNADAGLVGLGEPWDPVSLTN